MATKLKIIMSLVIGVPAMMLACGELAEPDGIILQLLALIALVIVLAINGAFNKEEERW